MRLQEFMWSVFAIVLSLSPLSYADEDTPWQSLLEAEGLDNWTILGGTGKFERQGNVIVGTPVMGSPNTFLTTKNTYGDMILEFEFQVDPNLNSGVQFRSQSRKSYQNGRVHGYQLDIDPTPRGYTGGIYDEGRRQWMYPIVDNPRLKHGYRYGQWNHVRIEAVGYHIRTWLNGEMAARLVDDVDARGFIGLQVHSIKHEDLATAKVKWRDLKIITDRPERFLREPDPRVREISYLTNTLTDWERRNGFRLLWDGRSPKGWRGAKLDRFPKSGWRMKEGVLTVLATDGGESTGPGDIVTEAQFADFELELEFRITEGANSGIKYYVDTELNRGAGSAIGLEYQILDNERHPDAKAGIEGNRTLAGLYDLMAPRDLSNQINQFGRAFRGIGNWNKARIVSRKGRVQHWLNNIKVVEFDRYSPIFASLVNASKYRRWETFGQQPQGHILLQDHGDEVSFRSIKIRELNGG